MELRQRCVVAASGTRSEQTPLKPWGCPGGCGFCCGVASLAASRSICGLLAAGEKGRCLYDPCCWSWEQLRQLIRSPTQADFHVVHVPIRDNGEIPAASGSFDIAVLGIVASKMPMLGAVAQSLVRCVRPRGLVVAVQPPFTACRSECTQRPRMTASDMARCVEFFHEHGCQNTSILNDSEPLWRMKHSCDGSGINCRCIGGYKSSYPVAVVARVAAGGR